MFDAIIVGARCAGSPLAMLLSRKGYRVLLTDKVQFPSDTVSTHLIWQSGLAHAKRWGLLERILELGAPLIRTVRFDVGEFAIAGSPPPIDGIDYAVAPRRTVLDKLLVNAAVQAGAELRERFYVSEILATNGRVTGIRGRHLGGAAVQDQARIVVGADGTHSFVAHSVKSPKYNEQFSGSCLYYAYWRGGPAVTEFEIYARPSWAVGAIPTNNGLACVAAIWDSSFADPTGPPEEGYRRCLERVPRIADFLRSGEQTEPLAGLREFPGFFRKPWGDGWALLGDAGYHKHALTAQGITDAFRDAELLATAIDDGFSGHRTLGEALADYEKQRNEAVGPMYESTCERARLDPFSPEMMALLRALRSNKPEADRFFGTDAGTVPIREYFTSENIARIVRSTPSSEAHA